MLAPLVTCAVSVVLLPAATVAGEAVASVVKLAGAAPLIWNWVTPPFQASVEAQPGAKMPTLTVYVPAG